MLAVLAAAMVAGTGAAARSLAPVRVAAINPRCNHEVAGALEQRVRVYDRDKAGTTLDALNERLQDLNTILQQAQMEGDILQTICTDTELPPIEDQIAAVIAWTYVLEDDIVPKRLMLLHCPESAANAPAALVASAWYAIASTLNDPNRPESAPTPTAAPLVKVVFPKVQAHAAAAGLTLPAIPESTEYWRDTIVARVPNCAPPTPQGP